MMWKSLMQNKNKNFFVEDISHSFLDCVKRYQKVRQRDILEQCIFRNTVHCARFMRYLCNGKWSGKRYKRSFALIVTCECPQCYGTTHLTQFTLRSIRLIVWQTDVYANVFRVILPAIIFSRRRLYYSNSQISRSKCHFVRVQFNIPRGQL